MTAVAAGIGGIFAQPFMRHAFVAGTCIAVAAGLVGYFLVLRSQVFTTDALGHVAFTGASGALAFGADARIGLYVGTVLLALALAGLGRRARADDVVIGSTFAWVLGLGAYFLALYTTNRSSASAAASVTYLFGSIFGLSFSATAAASAIALAGALALLLSARPLLFVTLDEAVAEARGVPVRALGAGFLVVVGLTSAEATQAVGALLILGIVSAPAGAAHLLTTRPYRALALSAAIAAASMWVGLTLSYLVPQVPPSFAIMGVAAAAYVATSATTGLSWRLKIGRERADPTKGGSAQAVVQMMDGKLGEEA